MSLLLKIPFLAVFSALPLAMFGVTLGYNTTRSYLGPLVTAPDTGIGVTYYDEDGFITTGIDEKGQFTIVGPQSDNRPDNGTAHVALTYSGSYEVKLEDGGLFEAVSVDLAEYSTVFPHPHTIQFFGRKEDGSLVSKSFTVDGNIDVNGVDDFQTFYFPSTFKDLKKLYSSSSPLALDNLVVNKTGDSSPTPTPTPTPTPGPYELLYSSEFEEESDIPGVVFGNPALSDVVVRSGNSLEFEGLLSYEQIRIPLDTDSKTLYISYYVKSENLQNSDYAFTMLMDTPYVRNLSMHGGLNEFYMFPSHISTSFQDGKVYHVETFVDMEADTWEVKIDGVQLGLRAFDGAEFRSVRFSMSPWTGAANSDDLSLKVYIDDLTIATSKATNETLSPPLIEKLDNGLMSVTFEGKLQFSMDMFEWKDLPGDAKSPIYMFEPCEGQIYFRAKAQ